ncbi:hypothetical protein ACSS6W_008600 [Trichoderma asperelloides]
MGDGLSPGNLGMAGRGRVGGSQPSALLRTALRGIGPCASCQQQLRRAPAPQDPRHLG